MTTQLPYSPYPVPTPWVNQPGASGYQASQQMQQVNKTNTAQPIPQGFVANPYSGPTYASPADVGYVKQQSSVPFKPTLQSQSPSLNSPDQSQPSPTNTSSGSITRSEALSKGWDVNNLPSGYSLDTRAEDAARAQYEAQVREQQQKVRDTINNGYNSIFGRLDQMSGALPGQEQQDLTNVDSQYKSQYDARNNDYQNNLIKLNSYRGDVETRKKASFDELASNMRNILKAGNTMLGAYGAGDSNAVGMYNYALAKQSDVRAGQLQKQANDQLSELDRKAVDVKSVFDQSVSDLDTWKNDSINTIRQTTRSKLDQINQARMGADQGKLQALASLETGLLNQAATQLSQIDAEHRAYAQQIDQWQRDRIAQLQNYKIQLTQSANFDPKQLTYDAMQGLNGGQFQNTQNFYNPYLLTGQKKKDATY